MTSFDASSNFGYGTIAVAPSPATSGGTFSLNSGDGANFPDTASENDYNLVVFPDDATIPTVDNAEIVRVTARSGDDFTVTRAQEGTSAIAIALNYKVLLVYTAKGRTDIEDAINAIETVVDPDTNTVTTDIISEDTSGGGVTIDSLLIKDGAPSWDGWIPAGETWTYASASDPEFTFTIAGVDLTTKYYAGMRIKLTQKTAKYFIITKVAFSTNTTITIYGGTDYNLANATITSPFYSTHKAPSGFPMARSKWDIVTTDTTSRSQASPNAGTWYNLGSISITVVTGSWTLGWEGFVGHDSAGAHSAHVSATLSTANNTESNTALSSYLNANSVEDVKHSAGRTTVLDITTPTTYYLNAKTDSSSTTSISIRGDIIATVIRARFEYL